MQHCCAPPPTHCLVPTQPPACYAPPPARVVCPYWPSLPRAPPPLCTGPSEVESAAFS